MADDQERAFLEWFTTHGGWIDERLSLQKIPGMGRGLVALDAISENERLFTISRSMLMNLGTSGLQAACERAEQEKAPAPGLSWSDIVESGWCALILMLMWENWRACTQSESLDLAWGPYFGIMPCEFSTPMFWTPEQLEMLQGTDVQDKIGRADAEKDYQTYVRPYIEQYPHVFVGASGPQAETLIDQYYRMDMYHRMGSSILSRSFHVKRDLRHAEPDDADNSSAPAEVAVERAMPRGDEEDNNDESVDIDLDENSDEDENDEDVRDISMVPMADMLNAKFGSENTRCFYKREALEMRCTKPIQIGEQLLNTYGNPPNSDLLRRYGFVDEPNRGDLLELSATTVLEVAAEKLSQITGASKEVMAAHLHPRFEWACTELGMDEVFLLARLSTPCATAPYGSTLDLQPGALSLSQKRTLSRAAGEVPDELVGFARLLCVTQSGFEHARKKEALPTARLEAVEPLDESWPGSPPAGAGLAVASLLADAVQRRAAAYPTTWSDTASQLVACAPSTDDPYRMALVVRAGDQVILDEHQRLFALLLAHARAETKPRAPGRYVKKIRK